MTHNASQKESLALLVDQYELTMAYGYWKDGEANTDAVFNLFFRKHPFGGGYTVAAGLALVCEWLDRFHFSESDLDYLATIEGNDGRPIFEKDFLSDLGKLEFACDVDALPEGTPAFPNQPLVRVRGPLLQCQILETLLLTLVNFSSLIATKAARMVRAAGDAAVIDFGLRRAQGMDGGLTASRAAYIGGCASTSNLLAGKRHGIPVSGTHAHSWIMFYDDERDAFRKFATAMPNNAVFLVDTYDSLGGVRNAIAIGEELRERGHAMMGVRLDSGDLGALSQRARELLDEAGFEDALIVASSELDEHAITELIRRGARIDLYGVGTKLVTGGDDPALGGVYKIAARRDGDDWKPVLKLSEDEVKINNPGVQQLRRFEKDGRYRADMIYDENLGPGDQQIVPDMDPERAFVCDADSHQDLLRPIYRGGRRVHDLPELAEIRDRTREELNKLPDEILRLENPGTYPTGLEAALFEEKRKRIETLRQRINQDSL